jgi:hypothetical protein
MCGSAHSCGDIGPSSVRALMQERIERKLVSSEQKELKRIECHGYAYRVVDGGGPTSASG